MKKKGVLLWRLTTIRLEGDGRKSKRPGRLGGRAEHHLGREKRQGKPKGAKRTHHNNFLGKQRKYTPINGFCGCSVGCGEPRSNLALTPHEVQWR